MKKLGKFQAIFGAVLLTASLQAQAIPITGSIGFGGNFNAVDAGWNNVGLAAATGIDFDPEVPIIASVTGDFATPGILTDPFFPFVGTLTDFQFDPKLGVNDGMGGVTRAGNIPDFWTDDVFSFQLTSVTKEFSFDPDNFLSLSGTGIISRNGLDHTFGSWTFTGDAFGGFGGFGEFLWSSGTVSNQIEVPEPGIILLLGMGILGFAASARLRK